MSAVRHVEVNAELSGKPTLRAFRVVDDKTIAIFFRNSLSDSHVIIDGNATGDELANLINVLYRHIIDKTEEELRVKNSLVELTFK